MVGKRTDLASEMVGSLAQQEGIFHQRRERDGIWEEIVEIRTPGAARRLGRARGRYVTLDLGPVNRRERAAFRRFAGVLAGEIQKMAPDKGEVLVVGLGNRTLTPDRLGPLCCEHLLITRHLVRQFPQHFGTFRGVAALTPGVLAQTGVESARLAAAAVEALRPACVIAVDALAARAPGRLCATVQLSDTGISPGSGVGNRRAGLDRDSLGVPVVSVGVPTVVDLGDSLLVTPQDIDQRVAEWGRLVGSAISLALQPGLTLEELEELMG